MKLHRPVAEQVILALSQIFGEGGYHADKVLERVFKNNRKLGARDRRFIAEATYDIVRWWRLLWAALGREMPARDARLEARELWKILGVWLARENDLPAWTEFKDLDRAKLRDRMESARRSPAVRESVPDWIYEIGRVEIGEAWDGFLAQLNRPAPVVLRANRLRATREELRAQLASEDIETLPAPRADDGLKLKERKNVFATEAFKKGLFEVQDGASQQVAPMLAPKPGERVIDACAGAGGKTLHLAALMKNKGKIISMDIHERKLEELRKRCSRDGVDIVEVRVIDSSKVIKRLDKTADRVLLDVPCSGLGVLRRNPDTKWKLKIEDVDRLRALQAQILGDYACMVKPGGHLVYATCSILPSENERQVAKFLTENEGWSLVQERRFAPGEDDYDGFYAALLTRGN